ncbi:MAG: hypothetical protein HOJ34_04025 [Kordiimonadaceae bacterium]|nr:hypothetical protein [Kordiimonadaceae bacterium]MBT6328929.1 hypothetical protein [Kordiimonadaceae bacterium]
MTKQRHAYLLFFMVLFSLTACSSEQSVSEGFSLEQETKSKAINILRSGLEDQNFWPSMHAAEGLTKAGYGAETREWLEARLSDETDDARRAGIARELVRAGELSKEDILAELLTKDIVAIRIAAAEGLYKVAKVGDIDAVNRAFQSLEDVVLHLMAAGVLVRQGDMEALEAIRNTYASGNGEAIRIGSWLLGRVGTSDDIPLLRARLDDAPDALIRSYIHHSMAALGDEEALNILANNLSSDDISIRSYATIFAEEVSALKLTPKLIEMLDDPVTDIRYRAATTLLMFDLN